MIKLFSGGTASIYVSSIDEAIGFYTDLLGLELINRIGNEWAEVDVGNGFIIGLHPASVPINSSPGTVGAISIELRISVSLSLDDVVAKLRERGVYFAGEIENYEHVRLIRLFDYDKNIIILAETI